MAEHKRLLTLELKELKDLCTGKTAQACEVLGYAYISQGKKDQDAGLIKTGLSYFDEACTQKSRFGCIRFGEYLIDTGANAKLGLEVLEKECVAENAKACLLVSRAFMEGKGTFKDP